MLTAGVIAQRDFPLLIERPYLVLSRVQAHPGPDPYAQLRESALGDQVPLLTGAVAYDGTPGPLSASSAERTSWAVRAGTPAAGCRVPR